MPHTSSLSSSLLHRTGSVLVVTVLVVAVLVVAVLVVAVVVMQNSRQCPGQRALKTSVAESHTANGQ